MAIAATPMRGPGIIFNPRHTQNSRYANTMKVGCNPKRMCGTSARGHACSSVSRPTAVIASSAWPSCLAATSPRRWKRAASTMIATSASG